jgi:hypothetical protein
MSNKAQASRINGAKSMGPTTPEGKAISSQNALKHGLTSSRIVLAHESQEDYDALESSLLLHFEPSSGMERELVGEIAASRWRLRRIEAMETAVFKKALREQKELHGPDADPADIRDAAYVDVAESKTMRMLARHAAQLRRAYEKAWKELEKLQGENEDTGEQNEPKTLLTEAMLDFLTAPPAPYRPELPTNPNQHSSFDSQDTLPKVA